MPSFYLLIPGSVAQAQDVNQIIEALRGDAGQGIPISLTALNDSTNFALALKNADPANSRAFQVLKSNNSVLFQADVNGVIVSPDGGAASAQVVNLSLAQTLTNKTLGAGSVVPYAAVGAVAFAAWPSVQLIQGGSSPTFTTQWSSYVQIGKQVNAILNISATGAGTAANDIVVLALPVAPKVVGQFADIGGFIYNRAGVQLYVGRVVAAVSTQAKLWAAATTGGFLGNTGGPSFAIASGDALSLNLSYEAA